MATLEVIDRGREPFRDTLRFQEELVQRRIAEAEAQNGSAQSTDKLVLVEHEPVYTLGRGSARQDTLIPLAKEVEWIEIGRGGQATFHGPGQIVAYPIFNLTGHGQDVHVFLRRLEEVIIRTLAAFDIRGYRREGLTGVWVDTARGPLKAASIGVGVRRWISFHGLALNVSTNLDYFKAISPCGESGEVMTSLAEIADMAGRAAPDFEAVKEVLVRWMKELFGFTEVKRRLREVRPAWLRARFPADNPDYEETTEIVRRLKLVTVCEEAHCPNVGECWSHRTATFMIMGELCTRRCSFCSVKDGSLATLQPLDPLEPLRVARAIAELGLRHVVITSVDRDDLTDMGANHFHRTVSAIAKVVPHCRIELLIPDMGGDRELVGEILKSGKVAVLNHNVETVPRLYREVRPGSKFVRSLKVLKFARELQPKVLTKSGLMVGLGEEPNEVLEVMDELRLVDCNILTIGQYLRPTTKQLAVKRFVMPEEFEFYKEEGLKRGFTHVEAGPLVRSSYHAWKHVEPESPRADVVGG